MKDRAISIQLSDITNQTKAFQSFRAFYDFCGGEKKFWEEQQVRVNSKIRRNHNHLNIPGTFQQIINTLNNLKENISEYDDKQLNQQLHQLQQNHISNLCVFQ